MTRYYIQSGGLNNAPKLRKRYHEDIISDAAQPRRFLLCNFAQGREYWEARYPGYCAMIREDTGRNDLEFKLAMPDSFEDQIAWADAVYMHGGDDHLAMFWLKKYDLKSLFENKIVATNSATSDALSVSFWPCDWRSVFDGLGLLPMKFIAHYGSDWGSEEPRGPIDWGVAYVQLDEYGDGNVPVLALKEGEYAVFENTKHIKTVTQEDV